MAERVSPTVRGWRLRTALRKLRTGRGLTIDQVVTKADGDLTSAALSRYETGERRVSPLALRRLLDIYDVQGEERETLMTLAREARQRGWWQQFTSDAVPEWFQVYVGMESEASTIHGYEAELVPGLLQTPGYYRSFLLTSPAAGDEETIERKVQVRTERQTRLEAADPPEFWVVINEAVVRRNVGGASVMRDQLAHVVEMARRPTINVQVLPFRTGAHQAMEGSFMLLGFREDLDPDIAYLEYQMGSLTLEGMPEVERFRAMFSHLCAQALGFEESVALIADAADQLA
jgi:transcriptional regulator with XRE-family HTH domain